MSISDKDQIVDDEHPLSLKAGPKTWTDLKIESVYLPAESWSAIKKYLIEQCKANNKCNPNVDSWDRKLNSLNP